MGDVIIQQELYGWVIFCVRSNRPYSRMLKNNELKAIYYPTSKLAKEEAIKIGYNILGYKKWD